MKRPMVEIRTPNSQSTGKYSDSTDQENEITPLHARFPGDFGLSGYLFYDTVIFIELLA